MPVYFISMLIRFLFDFLHEPIPAELPGVRIDRFPDKCRLADDIFFRQQAPIARVLRVQAFVTRHEIIVFQEAVFPYRFAVQENG